MAKTLAALALLAVLSGCSGGDYGGYGYEGTLKSAALGGLVGGAAAYVAAVDPVTGLAIGAVSGAAIDYFLNE